jgi:hypothetical protein
MIICLLLARIFLYMGNCYDTTYRLIDCCEKTDSMAVQSSFDSFCLVKCKNWFAAKKICYG